MTYSMDPDKLPKRPVVRSLMGAITEVKTWLRENQLDQVRDGEGLVWTLEVKAAQVDDPQDPRKVLWQLRIALTTQVDAATLVKTGLLSPAKDDRLLALLGDGTVDLAMKPLIYKAPSEDAAKALLADVLPQLKASFLRSSLAEVKRHLIGRWVDEQGRFGAQPMR
jgi:hypothetical protein